MVCEVHIRRWTYSVVRRDPTHRTQHVVLVPSAGAALSVMLGEACSNKGVV